MSNTTCTTCLGDGSFTVYGYTARGGQSERTVACEACDGSGEIADDDEVVYTSPERAA